MISSASFAAAPDEKKYYETGREAYANDLFDVAEINFIRLLEMFPQSGYGPETRLLLIESLVRQGKYDEAIRGCQNALNVTPEPQNPNAILFWMGESFSKTGRYDEGIATFQKVIADKPESQMGRNATLSLAWTTWLKGDVTTATEALKAATEKYKGDPEGAKASLLLAKIALQQKKFESASTQLDRIMAMKVPRPILLEAQFLRAQVYIVSKRYEEALALLKPISEDKKGAGSEVLTDTWFSLGTVYFFQKKYDEAAKAFELVFTKGDSLARRREALEQYVLCYVQLNRTNDGITRLRSVIEKNPDKPLAIEASFVIAHILSDQKNYEAALAEYQGIIARYPKNNRAFDAYAQASETCLQLKRVEEAVEYMTRARKNYTGAEFVARTYSKTGDIYLAAKDYEKAEEAYKKLITEFPRTVYAEGALYHLGKTYTAAENYKGAITAYQSLITQFPKSSYADVAQFEVAKVSLLGGNFPKAREAYAELLERYPNSPQAPSAFFGVADSYYREGKFVEAAKEYAEFAVKYPKHEWLALTAYNRCLAIAKQGQEEKTLAEFASFLQKHEGTAIAAQALFWMGNYYFSKQDFGNAKARFEQLARKFPKDDLADDAMYWSGKCAMFLEDYQNANKLFQQVVEMPGTALKFDARMRQGDALRQLDQFENALVVYETVLKESTTPDELNEARLGKAVSLYTLKKYDEAISVFQQVVDSSHQNVFLANEASYRLGKCLEKVGKIKEALAVYMDVVYGNGEPDPSELGADSMIARAPSTTTNVAAASKEFVWYGKAAFDAGLIKENEGEWEAALAIYKRVEVWGGPNSAEARDRKIKLMNEHFVF
ncbi:MAG: tetratricopeptide repeat protein [Verrucomicrobiota bacterium]|nr:tetratricopeptide repeat protein [Verrucomicrobiota bacterium]